MLFRELVPIIVGLLVYTQLNQNRTSFTRVVALTDKYTCILTNGVFDLWGHQNKNISNNKIVSQICFALGFKE